MDVDFHIIKSEVFYNVVPQKCQLPEDEFPQNLIPGTWMKCFHQRSPDCFTVCQVFPSSPMPGVCCMDNTVSFGVQEIADERLCSLEMLDEVQEAKEVVVMLEVTEKLFQNKRNFSLENLQDAISILMQSLYLTTKCIVRLPDLQRMGIEAVHISIVSKVEDTSTNGCFYITDDTTLSIEDVQHCAKVTLRPFYNYGFTGPQQKLRELLKLGEMDDDKRFNMHIGLNALLVGPSGSGKTSLILNFIKENKCNCFFITTLHVLGQHPGETEEKLRNIFATVCDFEQHLKPKNPTIILLEDIQLLCPAVQGRSAEAVNTLRINGQLVSLLDNIFKQSKKIFCIASTDSPASVYSNALRAGRFSREIAISAPLAKERIQLFQLLVGDSSLSTYAHELTPELLDTVGKQSQGYVIADLGLLVRNIEMTLFKEKHSIGFDEAVKEALKNFKSLSMRGADVITLKPDKGFNSIGGMQSLKRILEVSVLAGLKHVAAFERFGLNLPKGVLFYGPPGCAKTTFAKCLAYEANMTFIATSGAELYSPYVGSAEKYLARMFDTARKNAPCLIFLDEIDSLIGNRTMQSGGSSDVQVRILSTLLTEMDGIVGSAKLNTEQHLIVVAATNRPDLVDNALLRPGRFDKLIHVPPPDFESRLAILKLHTEKMSVGADVDLPNIADRTQNYSGADLCNICNEAGLEALTNNFEAEQISAADFETVLGNCKSSLTQKQIQFFYDFEKQNTK